jgi:hypothetical protein
VFEQIGGAALQNVSLIPGRPRVCAHPRIEAQIGLVDDRRPFRQERPVSDRGIQGAGALSPKLFDKNKFSALKFDTLLDLGTWVAGAKPRRNADTRLPI